MRQRIKSLQRINNAEHLPYTLDVPVKVSLPGHSTSHARLTVVNIIKTPPNIVLYYTILSTIPGGSETAKLMNESFSWYTTLPVEFFADFMKRLFHVLHLLQLTREQRKVGQEKIVKRQKKQKGFGKRRLIACYSVSSTRSKPCCCQ